MSFKIDVKSICEQLESQDRRVKTNALWLLREECKNAPDSSEVVAVYFDNLYLHLLKLYADRFEGVRDHAVLAVNAFLDILPPMDFHLLNVVSTLTERMGQTETVEPSEELRLLYVKQLHLMVAQYVKMGSVGVFSKCYGQVVKILIKSLKDAYPLVQREGCATLVDLCRVAETFELRPYTESLAKALYTMLNHKHAPARISAVEALGRLSLHMEASGDNMRRLFSEVSPLLMDSMPLVRRECGQMGVLLLMELPDRYSFFERILPLVLCCLKDDSPEVLEFIRPLWLQCGKKYYEENEAELSEQEISDLPVENYPSGVQRPTIGCRGLVQRSLRLLQLITRELADWKDNVRLHSLRLLYQFILHAEAAMTAKFIEVYPHVSPACCDSEAVVCAEAAKVADLMGRLLNYDAWIEHGFEGLERNAKESYLKCFYYMFTASTGGSYEQLLRLGQLLRTSDFSHTLKPGFQQYILKLLDTILDKAYRVSATQEQLVELYECIYVAGIKVMALSHVTNTLTGADVDRGAEVIERIAELEQTTLAKLHERFFNLVLRDVENLDAALDDNAEPVLLLDGLINICHIRAPYLRHLIDKVKLVFQHCNDSAQVRIFSSLSTSSLLWSDTVRREREQSTQLMSTFIYEIIEPHLIWQAGASAEAMRSLAMATLCALAQGATEEAIEILPSLAKHMPSLLEDRNVATRHYAIRSMKYFKNMSVEQLKPLAYATLQRIDDPSSGIRLTAVLAVGLLKPVYNINSESDTQNEREIWEAFVKRAMDQLLLHFESPEKDIRAAVELSLMELSKAYPEAWIERCERALTMVASKGKLEGLFDKLTLKEEPLEPSEN